jgi:hypothetical protein
VTVEAFPDLAERLEDMGAGAVAEHWRLPMSVCSSSCIFLDERQSLLLRRRRDYLRDAPAPR